jgi:aspartate/methionine/tyrosine aminotransferase
MKPALNPQVLGIGESTTLSINTQARTLRKKGKDVCHFGFGQAPFPVPDPIQKALRRASHKNDYLPTQGLPQLREAVASFYNKEFDYSFKAGDVFIGPGSKELLFQTLYILEGSLLIPTPSWVSYGPQAALRGKHIVSIATQRDNGYRLQAEELDRACSKLGQTPKILILNNPNNPTGSVYREHEIRELAEICRAYHVMVISDEIYAMIDFRGAPFSSIAHYYPEGTIVTGGLSKSFSAGGYRLGVMLIPQEQQELKEGLKSFISETFSAVSGPIQYAALEAYRNFNSIRSFIQTTCEIHRCVGRYMHRRLLEMDLRCPPPEGAFYLFPDANHFTHALHKRGIMTGKGLCTKLLDEVGVALLPGGDFYFPATYFGMRIAYVDYNGSAVLNAWNGIEEMNVQRCYRCFQTLLRGVIDWRNFLMYCNPK